MNYKEKTNNPVNCLIRLGLNAHSVNIEIGNHSVSVTFPEYQALYYGIVILKGMSSY